MRNALSMFSILLVSAFAGGVSAADAPATMPLPQVWAGNLEAPPDKAKFAARDIEIKIRALSSDKEVQALHLELRLGGQKRLREAMFRLEQKASSGPSRREMVFQPLQGTVWTQLFPMPRGGLGPKC